MNMRVRKLVGTIATVAFLVVYTLAASLLAGEILSPHAGLAQLAYYATAGLAWIVPVGLLIRWMQRE